jgi:putative alpha-1,2-mannosidase
MIGSPLFNKMSLRLANGKVFAVSAKGNSAKNVYIQSARLNGKPLTVPVIRYEDIVGGASLELVMGPSPSGWAADWKPAALSGVATKE